MLMLSGGIVWGLFGLGMAHVQMDGTPQTPEAKRAESRAEKRALIVTDDYIIGPEDILEISVWRKRARQARHQ